MSLTNNTLQEKVYAVCNELYKSGDKPTVRLVQSELPEIKSLSTAHKYLSMWKDEIASNEKSLYDKLGFSQEFIKSFMKEITKYSVEAETRYRESASDAIDQRNTAIRDLEKAEERLYKQNAVVEQQQKEIAEMKLSVAKALSEMEVEISKAEKAHEATVIELREQLSRTTSDNQKLSDVNESLRTKLVTAELSLVNNQDLVSEVKSQNALVGNENKQLNTQVSELSRNVAGLESTITGNQNLIEELKRNNKILESEKVKNTELAQTNREMRESLSEIKRTVAGLESTIVGNEKLITQLEKNIERLEKPAR